jgi:hypothetical protein
VSESGVVLDDHLLRDVMCGSATDELISLGEAGMATTGLWYLRLCAAFSRPGPAGRLTAPWAELSEPGQARLRRALLALPAAIELISLRELAWPAAELQSVHRAAGRPLSAAMAEALAAAQHLGAGIAVSHRDVGPGLEAAAEVDGVPFHIL